MMKTIRLAVKFFSKQKAANLLVIIIVVLMLYVTTIAYNQYNQIFGSYMYFKDTPISQSIYFMGRENANTENGQLIDNRYLDEMLPLLESQGNIAGVSSICAFSATDTSQDSGFGLYMYDEITANTLYNGFSLQGEWPWDLPLLSPYPVVVYNGSESQYKVGDVIELDIFAASHFVSIYSPVENKHVILSCKVVGITDKVYPFAISANTKSNFADTAEGMFSGGNSENATCVFLPYIDSIFHDYRFASDTMLIYFKDSSTEDDIRQFQSQINKYGYNVRGSEILQATKKEADYQFRKNFFVFYTLSGLVLVSLMTVSFLNAKRLTRNIAIYYINGCSNYKAIRIYLTYFTGLYLLGFGLYYAAISLQHLRMSGSSNFMDNVQSYLYAADPKMAAALGLAGLAASILFGMIPFWLIRRKSRIQLVKEN